MGISKAMMEHVIYANARVAAERGGTTICCTRYGNVMCSRGSVIPLFIDQIKAGKCVRIGSNVTICNNAVVPDGADVPDCTAVHPEVIE